MDSFQFDFDTDSTQTTDTTSTTSDLDWTAFQPSLPPTSNQDDSPFSTCWLSPGDDAVAPDNRSTTIIPNGQDDGIYFEIEHFFNGLNQQSTSSTSSAQEDSPGIIQPIHVNIQIPDHASSPTTPALPPATTTTNNSLPSPLVPRLSSSRSQCYHKLPDHAVKLMQEWYNANLDDPYPRSPDKKRFITEGNITAQQCRSWFANRRQRLKHVKRNHPRASSSNSAATTSSSSSSSPSLSSRLHQSNSIRTTRVSPVIVEDQQGKSHEHCYYCQQQQQQQQVASPSSLPLTLTSTTSNATTLNVVINQQTVEQLIHNSLRKLLYPVMM